MSSSPAASLPVTGNTEETQPENRAFYPALDGLRAIALLMVFGEHYLDLPWGWTGVDVFFVLSGFLITGILFDSRYDPHRVRNFYVRRTLRIFPLYYGLMLAFLLLEPFVRWQISWAWLVWPAYLGNFARFVHPYAAHSPTQFLADFQLIHAPNQPAHHRLLLLGHFWSLCVEEQFYLVWPWAVFFIRSRRALLWICAAMFPFCLTLRLVGQQQLPGWMLAGEALYRITPFRLDALLLGGLAALLLRGAHAPQVLKIAKLAVWPLLLAALLWAYGPSSHHCMEGYPYPEWKFTWGLAGVDVLSVLVLLTALQTDTVLYKVLVQRPLRWLGRISYGAYVFHDIFHLEYIGIAEHFFHHNTRQIAAVIGLAGTLAITWLSFRFFETPFLRLKNRWAPARDQAPSLALSNA